MKIRFGWNLENMNLKEIHKIFLACKKKISGEKEKKQKQMWYLGNYVIQHKKL